MKGKEKQMYYRVSIIKDKELIENKIIEINNESEIKEILGKKTHRACIDGAWTEPKYVTIVEEVKENTNDRREPEQHRNDSLMGQGFEPQYIH